MIIRRCPTGPLEALRHEPDGIIALAMHHHEGALPASDLENIEDLAVVQNEVIIGHENLERRKSVPNEGREFLTENLRRRIGNDQMKGGVDEALPLRECTVALQTRSQAGSALLQRKRHDQGVPARGCRGRSRGEIVSHYDPGSGGLCDMNMTVDPARQDK